MKNRMLISILLLIFGVVSAYSVEKEDKVDKSSYIKLKSKYDDELHYNFFMNWRDGDGYYIMFESASEKQVFFFDNVLQGEIKLKKNEEVTIYGVCESLTLFHPHLLNCDIDISHCSKIVELYLTNLHGDSIHISNNNRIHGLYLSNVAMNKVYVDNCDSLKELKFSYHSLPNATFSSIQISNLKNLETLELQRMLIKSLKINNVPKVSALEFSNRNMSYFEYKGGGVLTELLLNDNYLTECILENQPHLKRIDLKNNNIEKFSFDRLDSLVALEVSGNRLEQLDVAKMPALVYLNVSKNDLSSLDISKLKYLKKLYIDSNKRINKIDLSKSRLLEKVNISGTTDLETLDFSNLNNLQLVCARNNKKLASIDISNSKNLSKAIINDNPELKSISINNVHYLNKLDVSNNPLLTTLDLSKSYALDSIFADNCSLEELDFSDSSFLKFVSAKNNKLKKVNLGDSKLLETLNLKENELPEINLINNRRLAFVNLADNKLSSLNVDDLPYLRVLKIQGNRFTAESYDELYCQLSFSPETNDYLNRRNMLFLLNYGDDPNAPIVFRSNPKNITKNAWTINYAIPNNEHNASLFIPDSLFSGTYKCNYSRINYDNKIVITGKIGDIVKIGVLPEADNTELKLQIGDDTKEIKCNKRWHTFYLNFTDSLATFYGNISTLRLSFEDSEITENLPGVIALDVSNHSSIKEIYCAHNKMKRLNVRNSKQLRVINAFNNKIKELDLSTNKNLIEVIVSKNLIRKLDLSDNVNLRKLTCSSNPLRELNIKGDYSLTSIDIADTRFEPDQLDEIFCDVYGKFGCIYACNGFDDNNYYNVMESSSQILTDKKWLLVNKADWTSMKTNGTNTCAESKPLINRYPVFVGGILVNDANKDDIKAPGIEGKVSYDPETNTLRMENATISEPFINDYTITYFIYPMYHHYHYRYHYNVCDTSDRDFTIELVGNNRIIVENDWDNDYTAIAPIYAKKNLIFKGGGKLSFKIKDARYKGMFAGIYGNRKVIIDSCDIEFKSKVGLHALYSNDSLILLNNARFKCESRAAAIVSKFENKVYSKYKLYDGAVIFKGLNEKVSEPASAFEYYWLKQSYFIYGTMPYISIVPEWASVQESDDVESATFSLYPNPASDFINVNVEAEHIGKELILFNILGDVKYRSMLLANELRISLETLSKGMYIIQIGDERKKVMVK